MIHFFQPLEFSGQPFIVLLFLYCWPRLIVCCDIPIFLLFPSQMSSTEGRIEKKTSKTTNHWSPYDLYPLDNPRILLTNMILWWETNYDCWVKAMWNGLKAQNKISFIDKTITKPTTKDFDEAYCWGICNSMINGWIHNSIDPQLQPLIQYFDSTKVLWDDLKECFYVGNASHFYQLKSSMSSTKQQGMSVKTYYTKLSAI